MPGKIGLTLIAGAALLAAACGTTVQPGQRGVKYIALQRGGGLEKSVRPEGFYFQWAWNTIITYDVTWQSKTETVEALTAEALHVPARVTVTFRPDPEQIYRLATEVGTQYYNEVIRPPFVTITRSEFAQHAHNQLAQHSPQIEAKILASLRAAVAGKPIQIDRVSIDHIEFDRGLTASISRKLEAQQTIEQKQFELAIAERDAEIARTRARGESDAIRIRAEGEAQATVLAGEGQAKAQAAIDQTLTPRYLQYKVFDNPATRYYFVPTGKNGMPIIFNADAGSNAPPFRLKGKQSLTSSLPFVP
jgi:regulator of protease activity HflC (stomatin/prohibitin superfamily)